MKRMLATAAALALALAPVSAASASAPTDARALAGGLSDAGQQAIADLRTCLASNDVLNVYYLIDSSGSLARADDGGAGSDPETMRADILAASLEQLGRLHESATVNWGAGFFSSDFSATIGWREWRKSGPDQLEKAIRDREPGGFTNWPAALAGAQRELSAQQGRKPGCQVLVWLTDGQIDISAPDGQGREDRDALNAMCGAALVSDGASASGRGVFNALRQSGVVVVGALLATDKKAAAAGQVMRPLIEGSGSVGSQEKTCGESPIPSGYAHGLFVEATSPDALSQVFLQLGAQVAGGYPQPFEADGSFWIDPGVARFRIVLSGNWTLTPPAGSALEPASGSAQQPWATVSAHNGTVIDVDTTDPAAQGQWRLDAGNAKSLFLFSDLAIVFRKANTIERSPDGTTTATLVARVRTLGGEKTGLDVFGTADFAAWLVESGGARRELADAEVDRATGRITIPVPADVTAAEVVVAASIDPLTTSPHGLALAPITTQQRVKTVLPKEFPRVAELPVRLSDLEGSDGEATGTIRIAGPESGGAGTVCIAANPIVTSDSAAREKSWRWTLDPGLDADGCVAIAEGEERELALTAANHEAADSAVQATVSVELRSAKGDSLAQDVPIAFTSTHPVNTGLVVALALALLALGVLLPLVGLWLVNWLTTRLDLDPQIQRAVFPVRLRASGVDFPDAPSSDTALSERFHYRGAQSDQRALDDADLGRIKAVVPWFPLRAPAYTITPPAERALVAARTGRAAAGERMPDGSLRFAHLPFAALWAVTVPRAELLRTQRGDEIVGTAVIYHRFDPASREQYRERLAELARDTSLFDFAERQREQAHGARTAAGSKDGGKPRASAAEPVVAVPPRPGASAAARPPGA
ncbi:MAG: hypothetical protein QM611_06605, partial [Microbacterium sp.]|uniref:hypothetical protein n=1 Tax=Microbacterium sp. TaxID=51671 RepID=UPI0039E260E3